MTPLRHPSIAALIAALWFCAPLVTLRAIPLHVFLSGGVAAASAPIAFVSVAVNNFAATRSPTVILPTCSTNDIVLVVICADGTASFDGTPPTGWAELDEISDSLPDQTASVFWARVDGVNVITGSSTAWTNITAATETGISAAIAFSGCATSGSPINMQGTPIGSGSGTAQDGPSILPTVDNCMIVGIRTIDPGAATRAFTWDAPFAERLGYATTPSGVNGTTAAIYISSYLQSTPATISPQGDFDTAEHASLFTYALKP